jgi:hypothetical protein
VVRALAVCISYSRERDLQNQKIRQNNHIWKRVYKPPSQCRGSNMIWYVVNRQCTRTQQQVWVPFPRDLLQERAIGILSRPFSQPGQCQSALFVYVNGYPVVKGHHLQISARVCIHIGRNGSSAESATAMNARMIGSESGTVPEPASCGSRRWDPITTIIRMSFMTCSFSIACLLSRANDLGRSIRPSRGHTRHESYFTIYHSRGCSRRRLTES